MSFIPSANISFFHIPKNGGNTVTSLLKESGLEQFNVGHNTYEEVFQSRVNHNGTWPFNYRDLILGSYKVAIVRNPYDRVRSNYCFYKKYPQVDYPIGDCTFDEFLFNVSDEKRKNKTWYTQTQYIYYDGENKLDEIVRFENFPSEMTRIFANMNIDIKFNTRHNLRTNSLDVITLTEKQKDFIYDFYKDDFKNFGFKK